VSPFDSVIERRGSGCNKWNRFAEDVLPMWVADMDFAAAPPILAALRDRVDHGVLGYGMAQERLRSAILAHLEHQYGWRVAPEAVVPLPGVVPGFNLALRALCQPGAGVLVQTPVYPPMLKAPENWGLRRVDAPLGPDGSVDPAAFHAAATEAGQGGAFLLCNPHNPSGRVFRREELEAMASACLDAGLAIVSDDIHCDLLFDGRRHLPVATLSPEVAVRTITLMSAGKTWNIAGLNAAWAVVPDAGLRARFAAARAGIADHANILGLIATVAALEEGEGWRREVIAYLQANRDWLVEAVAARLPGIRMNRPEGTYLAWLDCAGAVPPVAADPHDFFLAAGIGFNPGPDFGPPGRHCVRLNFGCPRPMLEEGVARMERALRCA
jgi:cystathionine beta-lyase